MQGKVAIVTGAGGGIGAATAAELATRGASVLLTDLDAESATARAEEIVRRGGTAYAAGTDVRDEAAVRAMTEEATRRFGRLDILVNNAAATVASQGDDDLVTMEAELWDLSLEVNLRGPMLGCKYAIPHFRRTGGGVIVNISSGSGVVGEPTRFAYGASKAGINSLTRSVAAKYGKDNIRCVAVMPGITMADEARAALGGTRWLEMMDRHHATPRLGRMADIAKFVAFVASDDAGFVTGSSHAVDGGVLSMAPYAADMREFGTQPFRADERARGGA
ncbi:putative short-chain dehydrogenase/reductase SDR [Streptomyces sp. Tu6071]|uniref:SDR family NAD(P)-dependent oxidoreductase n=1 Tax=Streptomyces sp. Tu6071 TaxID=355249 RepID=UPI00020E52A1|nr:SDR family oxidoreductase [Streptomyces sp. Tu6071]EGJ73776.1 putative short-chain dehydrogenase/reductase SDR [Streptomyces sp. Tu6071]